MVEASSYSLKYGHYSGPTAQVFDDQRFTSYGRPEKLASADLADAQICQPRRLIPHPPVAAVVVGEYTHAPDLFARLPLDPFCDGFRQILRRNCLIGLR